MTSKPLFITIEGIDGSGKTTLASHLSNLIPNSILTREPLPLRPEILAKLQTGATQKELLPLFLEDRRIHLRDTIEPAIHSGKTVICDRYSDSTIAYQASNSYEFSELCDSMTEFPTPDLTLYIRVSPETAISRLSTRPEISQFENLSELSRISFNFHQLAQRYPDRITMVPNNGSLSQTLENITDILRSKEVL